MQHSAKYLEAKIGGATPVFIAGNYAWDVDENAEDLDGTTGEDAGYANRDVGVYDAIITLKGWMDVATGSYATVRRGTTITNLKLYRVKTDTTPAYVFPSSVVLSSRQGGEVRGKIEWNARIGIKGTYSYNDPA